MSRIFFNYRRQDTEGYVGRMYDYLAQQFERGDLFMDVDDINPGVDFVAALEEAVQKCDVFLAVIGPQWVNAADDNGKRRLDQWNDFVRIEIATAFKHNKVVIPVLVGRAAMPQPTDLPEDIAPLVRRNAIEISHQRFVSDMDRLIEIIKHVIRERTAATRRPDSESINRKQDIFKSIRDDLFNSTTSPLHAVRTQNRSFPVIGEGNLDAKILFIGESPGKNEAQQGRPFVGASGEVLADMLNSIQLKREDIFITNLVLDYPGEKREPTPEEIAYYMPFVDRLIDLIQPPIIATLGRFAMTYILKKLDLPEKGKGISEIHGKLIKTKMHYGEIHVVPLYHPAVVLYKSSDRELLKKDFAKLKLFI